MALSSHNYVKGLECDVTDELIVAVFNGNEEINRLLDDGIDLNSARDRYGNTILMVAAAQGNEDLVNTLLDRGADVNIRNYFGKSVFHFATAKGHDSIVEFLLTYYFKNIHETSFGDDCYGTVLHLAVPKNNLKLVELFLGYGCDVNVKDELGFTALHLACQLDVQIEIIELLLDYKAKVNAKTKDGRSVLYVAAEAGCQEEAVKLILRRKAKLKNKIDLIKSALHAAVKNNREAVVELLLGYVSKDDFTDSCKKSLVQCATKVGNEKIVNLVSGYLNVADVNEPSLKLIKLEVDDSVPSSSDVNNLVENESNILFFFDIQTGGLQMEGHLLQIAFKSGDCSFSTYIQPVKRFKAYASMDLRNFLKNKQGELFYREYHVPTVPLKTALDRLLEFLRSFSYANKKIVLVHYNNRKYDVYRLLIAIKQLEMIDEFRDIVDGFTDTCSLLGRNVEQVGRGIALHKLANKLKVRYEHINNATYDVELIETLSLSKLSIEELLQNKQEFDKVLTSANNSLSRSIPRSRYWKSLDPLTKSRVVSKEIVNRLAENKLSLPLLIRTFKNAGEEAVVAILEQRVDGKPQVIKTKKVLDKILDYLRTSTCT